uniref:Abnormal cell migration protein 18-like fibronectin type I domain-containing protein n=1 Tax=Globodera rostochiensis TaxID=31243 RepID=A0A914I0A9_GLORO
MAISHLFHNKLVHFATVHSTKFETSFSAKGMIRLTSVFLLLHQGNQYRNGEEWTVFRSFIMNCTVHYNRWETKIIACLSMMGERIPVHGQITDQHGVWKCVQDANGSTRLVQQK